MCTFGVEFIHCAMIEKLQVVVLRTIKYNDKNAIVRVYTDMHGVMAFLLPQGNGKVARQRRALFQPLSLVEIVADIRQGRDLYNIKEARCLQPLHSLHADPVKNAVALFVTELLSAVIVEQERNPALFSFVAGSVVFLDRANDGIANFHICFLYNLGVFVGIEPDRDTYRPGCVFDMEGGVFSSCRPVHGHYVEGVEAEAVYRLSRITYANMHLFRFNRGQRNRLLQLTLDYYRLHNSALGELHSPAVLADLFS